MIYTLGVPRNTARPNAGKLWAAWMLTAEGQEALWGAMKYGMAVGDNLSPHGTQMKAANMEIVLEGTDQKELARLIQKAGQQIGSLQ
jgi:ABC-type Fe3+ transport system substrate-binding protein